MKWSYKTVHFELKREGLLGGSFLDEAEIEEQLNDFGRSGWELISVIEVQDGIIAFFKQPLDLRLSVRTAEMTAPEDEELEFIEEPYDIDEPFEPGHEHRPETETAAEPEFYADDSDYSEASRFDHRQSDELSALEDEEVSSMREDVEESYDDQDGEEEQDPPSDQRGIGAIRIE